MIYLSLMILGVVISNQCCANALPYANANDSTLSLDNQSSNSNSSCSSVSTSNYKTPQCSRNLKCILMNARSIVNKVTDLHSLLTTDRPHVVAITETHLDANILDTELVDNSYSVVRRDRNRQGGGVMIITSNKLPTKRRCDLESSTLEILWVEITLYPKFVLLGLLYRPPSSKDNFEELHNTLNRLSSKRVILCGDFTICLILIGTHTPVHPLIHHHPHSVKLPRTVLLNSLSPNQHDKITSWILY